MHLKKLFSGIHKVEFNKDNSFILAMISSNNENVQLLNKIQVDEIVESWLNILAKTMVDTLVKSTNECSAEKQLELNKYCSQVLCLNEELIFTDKILSAIKSNKLKDYH